MSQVAEVTSTEEDIGNRFVVHRSGENVQFYGTLTDTTTFEALDDVLTDGSTCDFSTMAFASWIGLTGFTSYITTRGIKVKIMNIPRAIFECLKILDGVSDNCEFVSAEVTLVSPDGKGQIGGKELKALEADFNEAEIIKADDSVLLLPQRFVMQSAFRTEMPVMFSSGWMADDPEEASFWMGYLSFCQSTYDLSSILLNATKIDLLELLMGIRNIVEGGEQALQMINPNTSYTLVKRMSDSMESVEKRCEDVLREMENYANKTREILGKAMLELHVPTSKENFFQILQEFFKAREDVAEIARTFEHCGPSIGDEITKLRVVNVLKGAITNITEMEEDQLEEIRDAFGIMDFESEDSWPDTKVEILKEIDDVENKVGKCVTTLQGFDLLRQILEHRVNEGSVVVEQLPDIQAGNIHWAGLKDAVFEKIGQHLVTDQEKAAYSFYLPEGYNQFGQVERSEPGDVLLF